ncbi:MAG: hypothetical protein AAF493_12535 [Pseudomonadota bacterium]
MPDIRRVVLFDPASIAGLEPVVERRALALLPVGGKPVVQYWLERLTMVGIERVDIALRYRPEQVRALVGTGERWGIDVCVATVTDALSDAVVASPDDGVMAISLASVPVSGFEQWWSGLGSAGPTDDGGPVQVWLGDKVISAPKNAVLPIDSLTALWEVNMLAMDDGLSDPNPPGFAIASGQRFGLSVRIHRSTRLSSPCRIGDETHIADDVHIGSRVSVGAGCIVETASHLQDCVICDGTFVGSHSEIRNAVVDGRLIYHVDLASATWVDDPLILGERDERRPGGLLAQTCAALLLVLLLPVVGLSMLRRLLGAAPFWQRESVAVPVGRSFDGSFRYRSIEFLTLNSRHPIRRKIPWLWQAMTGAVGLVGIRPKLDDQAELPEWGSDLRGKTPGVVSLADIQVARDNLASPEQMLIADSFYLATRSRWTDAVLIARWFLLACLPARQTTGECSYEPPQ